MPKTLLENPLKKNTELTLTEHLHMASHKHTASNKHMEAMEAHLQAIQVLVGMVARVGMEPRHRRITLPPEASLYM